jgi:hypothetical protein
MKKFYLLTLICCLKIQLFAAIRTLNNGAIGAQFNTLQSAYDASIDGDTIMISGSAISYSLTTSNWDKNLVLIGPGFNTDKQIFQEAKLYVTPGLYFKFGSPSRILGVSFLNYVNLSADVNGLYFEACKFGNDFWGAGHTATNISFVNCVFTNGGSNFKADIYNAYNILFSNCVFYGIFTGSNNNYNCYVTVDHCLFMLGSSLFVNMYNINISNSIFNAATSFAGVYNSSFTNNISRADNTLILTSNGNVSSNNLNVTDPQFITNPGTIYTTASNYNLQPTSPALAAGTGGSNIGVHDSSGTFNEEGEPQNIPVVRRMDIQNQNVPQNGNVNVKVRSTKSRTN